MTMTTTFPISAWRAESAIGQPDSWQARKGVTYQIAVRRYRGSRQGGDDEHAPEIDGKELDKWWQFALLGVSLLLIGLYVLSHLTAPIASAIFFALRC
jgi:hypothetical protein